MKLHPGDGFTGDATPDLTLSADTGELRIKLITDSSQENAGFSAIYSADCPQLQPGAGAISSSQDTTFGSVVQFTCPLGQVFATGVSEIRTRCQMGGQWTQSYIPACQEVYCGAVPQIDNGFAVEASNVTYRGVANYQCYAGFSFPSGNFLESIVCMDNGQWSPRPNCQGETIKNIIIGNLAAIQINYSYCVCISLVIVIINLNQSWF